MFAKLSGVVLVAVLTGCMTVPHQDYNKSANAQVKKIGVVTVPNPEEYSVAIVHHPGYNFGLVGSLVAAADTSDKTKTFTQQQVGKYIALGPELAGALQQALRGSGFEVIEVPTSPAARSDFLKDYPPAQCDAYLDATVMTAGYWAEYPSTPYLPSMHVPVRLVDAHTKKVLYVAHIFNSDGPLPDGAVQMTPDPAYSFADFNALKAAPDRAAQGMKEAAQQVAGRIVSDIK